MQFIKKSNKSKYDMQTDDIDFFLFKDSHSDFPVANLLFGDTFWVRVGHVMNLAMGTEPFRIYVS